MEFLLITRKFMLNKNSVSSGAHQQTTFKNLEE